MPTALATTPAAVVTPPHVESSTNAVTPCGDFQSYVARHPEMTPLAPATTASGRPNRPNREPTTPPSAAPVTPAGDRFSEAG